MKWQLQTLDVENMTNELNNYCKVTVTKKKNTSITDANCHDIRNELLQQNINQY